LMICSSVNLPLRIVCLLGGEQNPNSKLGAFQGSRSGTMKIPLLVWEQMPDAAKLRHLFERQAEMETAIESQHTTLQHMWQRLRGLEEAAKGKA
jgi:hypothetical protein